MPHIVPTPKFHLQYALYRARLEPWHSPPHLLPLPILLGLISLASPSKASDVGWSRTVQVLALSLTRARAPSPSRKQKPLLRPRPHTSLVPPPRRECKSRTLSLLPVSVAVCPFQTRTTTSPSLDLVHRQPAQARQTACPSTTPPTWPQMGPAQRRPTRIPMATALLRRPACTYVPCTTTKPTIRPA